MLPLLVVMLSAALGSGCLGPGTTRSTQFYALSAVAPEQPAAPVSMRVGIMPVRLPGYLDRPALVIRQGAEIIPRPFSAWAAPLDHEFTRVLAQNLMRRLPGYDVARFPWRRSFEVEYRLSVEVERFEIEGHAAVLHARWHILGPDGREPRSTRATHISVPVPTADDQARVAALNTALERLSAEVARDLES